MNQDILTIILGYLQLAAQIAAQAAPGEVGQDAAIANTLIAIAQAAIAAHTAQTGEPLDLSLIAPIDPLPVAD